MMTLSFDELAYEPESISMEDMLIEEEEGTDVYWSEMAGITDSVLGELRVTATTATRIRKSPLNR